MPEAAEAAIEQARSEFGLKELWANVLPENKRSERVLRKIGMIYCGQHREARDQREGTITLLQYRMKLDG